MQSRVFLLSCAPEGTDAVGAPLQEIASGALGLPLFSTTFQRKPSVAGRSTRCLNWAWSVFQRWLASSIQIGTFRRFCEETCFGISILASWSG